MWYIVLVVLFVLFLVTRSTYTSHVTCLSADETNQYLAKDPDGFVGSLNQWDLFARKVSSPQEYLDKISKSGITCDITYDMTSRVDNYFRSKGDSKIADMPWTIAMTDGTYEQGYPHTRQNIIFLSRNEIDFETMVHEKLHVYQRYNPPDLAQMGFKYLRPRQGEYRLRSNPDISDGKIWEGFGKAMVAHYLTDRPMGLSDVDTEPQFEHPYEWISYNYTTTQ